MIEDAARWGIDLSPDDLDPDVGAVWAGNVPALRAFLAVETQWRWISRPNGTARATGLDYTACDAGLRRAGIETTPELWEELQIIELAARAALNEA